MNHPTISVVVAAWNTPALLERCLGSLAGQCKEENAEVIVASNYDNGAREMIRIRFPEIRHLRLAEGTTVPQLRAQAISMSKGEVVALLEDHCFVASDWCAEIKKAHRLPCLAVGGSVENASTTRAIDWAVYFLDYGKYMLPGEPGTADSLPGNNVSYKRSALDRAKSAVRDGFFETFFNWELKSGGNQLYFAPSAIVYHNKNYGVREAFVECYHHGRCFAAMRVSSGSWINRITCALMSILLPVLLPTRIVLLTFRKRRHGWDLCMSLPHVLFLLAGWSCGEFTGYLAGEGGSASKWA